MQIVLVANPKGGAGKSTLSTSLCTWFAWNHRAVVLGDLDRQQSARYWLQQRPAAFPNIGLWEVDEDNLNPPPKFAEVAVLDSPAGLRGKRLDAALKMASHLLVPVQASSFDMWASRDFFAQLAEEKAVRKGRLQVGIVGSRVKAGTNAAKQLDTFLAEFDLPVVGNLRDTQYYIQTLPRGLGLFDLPASTVLKDRAQWQPITDWLAA
jgi:chromosome partitioning protein